MHPGLISIEAQIAAMAARWGGFTVVQCSGRAATWEGWLCPQKTWYHVRIAYRVPLAPESFRVIAVQPRVQILDPVLELHPSYEEGPLPHVYINRQNPALPYLCLFDPYNHEWTPTDLIADTTVPWTARHLYFYEGWLLTHKWKGGGRHASWEERRGDGQGKILATV